MKLPGLLVANARQTVQRFRALLTALVVGLTLLVASAAVVGGSVAASATSLDSSSELSALELLSVAPSGTPKQLTPATVGLIRSMAGVEKVVAGGSVGSSLSYVRGGTPDAEARSADGLAGVFWAMPRFSWSQPPTTKTLDGRPVDADLQDGEVLLPDSYLGTDLSVLVGAELSMEYTKRTGSGQGTAATRAIRVAGVYDNHSPRRDGDSALYVSEGDFKALFAALLGSPGGEPPADATYTSCWVKAASVADANRLARELTADGYYVSSGGGEERLPYALKLLQQVNVAMALLLALFGFGIGVTLAGTWSQLRRWDVGLLTSLGWSSTKILRLYSAEIASVGGLVGGAAVVLGTVATVVASLLLQGRTFMGIQIASTVVWPPGLWLVGILVGVPAAFLLGGAARIIRLSHLDPDDALRRPD
jgi:hypothetical protein